MLVLSTKNLSKAQTEQVLSAAGLLNVEKQLTTAQLSERLAKELNSKADAEALLINSGLITQKELEENATIRVTAAKINESVANGTLSASDAGVIAGALGITGVNTGATISFDLLTASIWANIKALGTWLVTNPIGWAILGGTAIFGLVKAYDALTDSVEEVKERTDALLDTYNSAISEANSNAQTIESLASRYEKLSKGVNNLGENVSLTADEYLEYNDIVNQIADMFPTMITGYTDEGNAILSLKGNVEELRDAYKEAQKEAYNLLIVSGKDNDGNDIITNYQNQVHGNESWLSKQSSYIDGEAGAKDAIEIITRLTGALTPDEFRQTYNQLYEEYKNIWNSDKIQDALKSSGFEELTHAPKWTEITVEDLANVKHSAQATIQTYNAEINSQLKNVQTLANAYLMTNSDYEKLDDQSKTLSSLLVNTLDENIANEFSSKEDIGAYVDQIVNSIKDNREVQDALIGLFSLDTSEMSIDESQETINKYIQMVSDEIGENPTELKVRLGFDDSDTQPLINSVKEKLQDDFDDKVGELTLEELQIAAEQIEVSEGTLLSWDELISKIKEVQSSTSNDKNPISLSITETVDQINTQLKPAFDSLKSAYEDIFSLDEDTGEKLFSLDDVDISTFESIRAELEKLNEIEGISVDYSPFERFVSVLSDTSSTAAEVQQQFDTLATSIIYTTDCTNMSVETYKLLVKSLTEMGITNADEVLSNLRDIQEELVSLGYDVSNITAEEAAELIRLGAVSAETTEYFKMYLIQKQLAQNPLNTIADITALEELCNALGVTGELYKNVIALKNAFDAKERGAVSAGLDASIEYYQEKIEELANGQADFKFNFNTPSTSKASGSSSKSKSEKDTTKEFDWIEQAIENVEKEVQTLDDVVNSAYSTFSQKNEALAQEIGKVSEEIKLQQQAYDAYMQKAESIGLSDEYKTLIRDGAINIENISDENLQEKISDYQQWYEKAVEASEAISELSTQVKDLHVKGYELQTDRLGELLDNEAITEKQYISEMTKLYKQYYENQTDYAVQAHEAKMALLNREKEYLNSVANAAASLLDREIDKVQDNAEEQAKPYQDRIKEAEKQIDVYEDQIDVFEKQIDAYNKEIDLINDRKKPLEDELDALEDKAREENLILDLQQKQYKVKRAENQRDKLVNYMPDTIVI